MHFILPILVSILASTFVASAPALDAATLLNNGQAAQKLNAQFQNLKASNSCQTGETACIGNAIATCSNSKFDTSTGLCEKTQSCFALPNVRAGGTILRCTSLNSALSLINATGATGGLTGDDNTNSDEGTNSPAGKSTGDMEQNPSNFTSVTAASATTAAGPDIVTVTVTLTATPAPVTVEASTQTLSPEQASSLLFSILGQADTTSDSPLPTSSASVAPPPAAATISSAAAASGTDTPSSVIQLTAAQITESLPLSSTFAASTPAASATPSSITQESAVPASSPAAAAAAVVTSPAASTSSGGYDSGSYGGY